MKKFDIVVVGASVAAEALTSKLGELDYSGEILVVDRDPRMPYERPPLSKHFLTAHDEVDISVDWDQQVEFERAEAVGLEPENNVVHFSRVPSGESFSVEYDRLVITTGAQPFHLPIEPSGVLSLRTADDSEQIGHAAQPGAHIGIIGAGAIGCELATSLRTLNTEVTLFDKAEAPLERLLAGNLGETVTAWLTELGVRCEFAADLTAINGGPGEWVISLGDGRDVRVDALVSAVGARPTVGWLAESGLLDAGQLVCDHNGQVLSPKGAAENIFAAGDVVTRLAADGSLSRTESWTATAEQGARLAEVLVKAEITAPEQPYFWTDVAGRKIQVLGMLHPQASLEIVSEQPERRATLYKASAPDGTVAWLGINSPQLIAKLRMGLPL